MVSHHFVLSSRIRSSRSKVTVMVLESNIDDVREKESNGYGVLPCLVLPYSLFVVELLLV
jgi:hypothetical protein